MYSENVLSAFSKASPSNICIDIWRSSVLILRTSFFARSAYHKSSCAIGASVFNIKILAFKATLVLSQKNVFIVCELRVSYCVADLLLGLYDW